MYVLDTNTLIYFFKGMGKVADNLLSKEPQNIYVPSIVIYELEVGIAKSNNPTKRREQLNTLASHINIIDFTEKEARISASIRASLEAKGTPIGNYDTLIAGTALCHNAKLVTRNTKEFERVEGLELENWF